MNISIIFLTSVLILGITSYPTLSPTFQNSPHFNSTNLSLTEIAFAQEDNEEEPEEEIEIEAEVEDGIAKVEVEIGDEELEFEFELASTDLEDIREEIVSEILARTDLTIDQIGEFEIEFEEELEVEELEEVEDQLLEETPSLKVEAETLGDQSEVKVELEFVTNSTDLDLIIDEIIETFALTREQADSILEIETEDEELEEKFEVEIEIQNEFSEVEVELRFIVNSTDRDVILDALEEKTMLTAEQINNILELEIEEAEEEVEEEAEEIEIEVEVKKGKTKIKIELGDEKLRFVLDTTDESEILSLITEETGLAESQIRAIWEFEIEDEEKESDDEEREKELSKLSEHRNETKENAEQIILELQQRIEELEQRLQLLLEKFETGEYFGPVPEPDPLPTSYSISFDGSAMSLEDDSIVADVDGEVFLETLASDASKFRITGGEILIGDTFYDFVIGKARVSSTGPSGEKDSMIILGQVMDNEGNINTIKIILDTDSPFDGDFGLEPVKFEITKSKIAKQWNLSASGQLSLLEV